ncbi:MAG: helix-turn-helix transcriptional regulator [Alphaproteobacteria bacterium]|nr:helix-turn-helix transcriptional regulator [Alphaproteobacteria bacterium]
MTEKAAMLNEAIGDIYRAALDSGAWENALRQCCSYLDGAALQLYAIDPNSRDCLFHEGYGLPPEYVDEYNAYFSKQSNRNEFHLNHPEIDVGYDYLMLDERGLDRSACSEWRAKFGFRYYLGGPVMRADGTLFLAALQRSAKQGHPQRPDIDAYRGLRGHLAQALRIQRRLDYLELRRSSAWEAIERSALGVVVLDKSGCIVECNRLALRMLALADGLAAKGRELRAVRPIDDRALKRLVGAAFSSVGVGGNLAVARRGHSRPYSLIVTPIKEGAELKLPTEGRVLILVNDPDSGQDVSTDLLRSHYGLTRKQVQLTILLTQGLTVAECADKLEIAEKTVRRHLATIFARTDVHRQADLIRLVLSLPGLRPR